jgi:hypothetical protein
MSLFPLSLPWHVYPPKPAPLPIGFISESMDNAAGAAEEGT